MVHVLLVLVHVIEIRFDEGEIVARPAFPVAGVLIDETDFLESGQVVMMERSLHLLDLFLPYVRNREIRFTGATAADSSSTSMWSTCRSCWTIKRRRLSERLSNTSSRETIDRHNQYLTACANGSHRPVDVFAP